MAPVSDHCMLATKALCWKQFVTEAGKPDKGGEISILEDFQDLA